MLSETLDVEGKILKRILIYLYCIKYYEIDISYSDA